MCVFAESVFIVRPETGMTEKLSKLELRGPQGFQVRNCYVNINISSEGDIIKLSTKGRSSWVVLLFVIKMNSFRGGGLNLQFVGSGYCGSVSLLLGSWWYHRRLCLFVLPGIALLPTVHV